MKFHIWTGLHSGPWILFGDNWMFLYGATTSNQCPLLIIYIGPTNWISWQKESLVRQYDVDVLALECFILMGGCQRHEQTVCPS